MQLMSGELEGPMRLYALSNLMSKGGMGGMGGMPGMGGGAGGGPPMMGQTRFEDTFIYTVTT